MGESGGQGYPVDAALTRELLALVDRNRHAGRGLDQQPALGEKPREQHPVPLLVRALGHQVLDALLSTVLKAIAELTTSSAQATPERLLSVVIVGHGSRCATASCSSAFRAPASASPLAARTTLSRALRNSRESVAMFS